MTSTVRVESEPVTDADSRPPTTSTTGCIPDCRASIRFCCVLAATWRAARSSRREWPSMVRSALRGCGLLGGAMAGKQSPPEVVVGSPPHAVHVVGVVLGVVVFDEQVWALQPVVMRSPR